MATLLEMRETAVRLERESRDKGFIVHAGYFQRAIQEIDALVASDPHNQSNDGKND